MSDKLPHEQRPSVPAEVRRKVLVEAGHRCAIHTCRYIDVDVHHIVPWSTCREHKYDNLIALCPNCHRRADRGDIDRKSLRIYKANMRFVHDKFSQLELDILFEANVHDDNDPILWPPFMRMLIKRILDSGYIEYQEKTYGVFIDGMKTSPDHLRITQEGKQFITDIGLKEM